MTSPQSDPATDVGAALARLAEQVVGIHRRMDNLEKHLISRIADLNDLTDAKFVTQEALRTGEGERVALALDASKEAIGKAEVATNKAIEKESEANTNRFASVNEFRQQLNDQARTFMPRTEAVQLATQAEVRIRELSERYTEAIGEIKDRLNRAEGVERGAKDNKAGMYAALGIAVTVIVAAIALFNFISAR